MPSGAGAQGQGAPAPPSAGLQLSIPSLFRAAPSFSGAKQLLGWEALATTSGRAWEPLQPLPLPARVRGRGVGVVLGPASSGLASGGEGGLGVHSVKMIRGTQKALGFGAACGERRDEGESDPGKRNALSWDGGLDAGEPSPFLAQMGKPRQGRVVTEFTQQVRGRAGTGTQVPSHPTLGSPTFWQGRRFPRKHRRRPTSHCPC